MFLAMICVCALMLVFSGFLLIDQKRNFLKDRLNLSILDSVNADQENHNELFNISINEDDTLLEVAKRNNISFDKLCNSLNIDVDTDPNTKICELFDRCNETK